MQYELKIEHGVRNVYENGKFSFRVRFLPSMQRWSEQQKDTYARLLVVSLNDQNRGPLQ